MRTRSAATLCILTLLASPVEGASVSKTYTYFTIGGTTMSEIEDELQRRGPQMRDTGARHPGVTRLEFTTRITYGEQQNGRCRVVDVGVSLNAEMILPRWTRHNRADGDTRLVWDTLAADIKRHEEAHVDIGRSHARELENELKTIRNQRDCATAQQRAQDVQARILAKHDREQERFDRVEGINFENRMLGLIRYRMQQREMQR